MYAWTPRQQRMEVEKGFPNAAEQPTARYSYVNKVLWYIANTHSHTHTNIHLLGDGWMSAAQGSCYIKINNGMSL